MLLFEGSLLMLVLVLRSQSVSTFTSLRKFPLVPHPRLAFASPTRPGTLSRLRRYSHYQSSIRSTTTMNESTRQLLGKDKQGKVRAVFLYDAGCGV